MNYEEIYRKLVGVLDDLVEGNRQRPVIVEGERDVRSLRALGVTGEILALNTGTSVFNLAESLAPHYHEAIILTDWDRRGGQLCRLLMDALDANGVRAEVEIRARLTYLCRKDIKDVESLAAHVERLSRRVEAGRMDGKTSKAWYAGRKSRSVRDRRARRIEGRRRESTGR